ncbi:PEP/pyruvate-binding domain-containing protein [Streptomyces sediminimaris]|uniref:PEP/pyruvate-binding domain-containing protein n=1 Tax=Streptomyces sediminimaris TaxID=3383721 RepID=UPI00399A59C0
MSIITLAEVDAVDEVGPKALSLALLARQGLPVPPGFCVTQPQLAALEAPRFTAELDQALGRLGCSVLAVRSSAADEDGSARSYAGVFTSVVGVRGVVDDVCEALRAVRASAHSDSAVAYRSMLGLRHDVRMAAIVQEMIDAEASGVLFTVHPVTGAPVFLVESAWGLGQSTVAGGASSDRFTLDRTGRVMERENADKKRMVRAAVGGGTAIVPVPAERRGVPSLTPGQLEELAKAGARCEALLGGPQDIEWAFTGGRLRILQSRPVTV